MLSTSVFLVAMLTVLLGGLAAAGILGEGDVILALATLAMGMAAGYGLGWWGRSSAGLLQTRWNCAPRITGVV